MYSEITEGKVIPNIAKQEVGANIHPLIVGDSAFPFKTWLMKPYTNARGTKIFQLSTEQGQGGDRRGAGGH